MGGGILGMRWSSLIIGLLSVRNVDVSGEGRGCKYQALKMRRKLETGDNEDMGKS
jgi:hypothetical protein